MLFGRGKAQLNQRISTVENSIRASFSKVREEMDTSKAWLNYYYQRSLFFEDGMRAQQAAQARLEQHIAQQQGKLQGCERDLAQQESILDEQKKLMAALYKDIQALPKELHGVQEELRQKGGKNQLIFHIENISKEVQSVRKKLDSLTFLPARIEALREEMDRQRAH